MSSLIKHKKEQINDFKDLALIAAKSGQYKDMSQESLLNLMLSAADFGVGPMKAINGSFHIVKGKIVMSGHLINDRIRAAGHSIRVVEHTREKCVIIGIRKDNQDSYKSEFDMEDAKLAGLLGSPTWKSYPKDMLYNRAIARLGRVLFSDVVGACYSEDEANDIAGIPIEERKAPELHDEVVIPMSTSQPDHIQVVEIESDDMSPLEKLSEHLSIDGISTEHLHEFLQATAIRKSKTVEEVIESALKPDMLPLFKDAYVKKFFKKMGVGQQVTA